MTGNRQRSAIFDSIPTNNKYAISGTYVSDLTSPYTATATGYMVIYINTPHSQSIVDSFYVYEYGYNTYPINLPEGMELCKIGNYQDYFYKDSGKWYLHKETEKLVFNGSENWTTNSTFNCYTLGIGKIINQRSLNSLSNLFVEKSVSSLSTEYGMYTKYTMNLLIGYPNSTLNDFKAFLNTNNMMLYTILNTPTDTEITYQPLIEQLNNIEKAMSKQGQTNISQVNNDKPFIISAEAIMSLQNVLDRIELLEG